MIRLARGMPSTTAQLQVRQMASVVDKAKETLGKVTEKMGDAFTDQARAFGHSLTPGKVGKQFNPDHEDGSAGKTAEEVGGTFEKDGKVGHQFTREGSVGGTVEQAAEATKEKGQDMKDKAQD